MDSSNSSSVQLKIALDTYSVDLQEMPPVSRLALLQEVIKRCQPLKYFPGFKSPRQLTEYQNSALTLIHSTPPGVLVIEEPGSKFFLLREVELLKLEDEPSDLANVKKIRMKRQALLIDTYGRFIQWDETFVRREESTSSSGVKVSEIAYTSRFSPCAGEVVAAVIERPYLVHYCIQELFRAVKDGVLQQEKHLDHAKRVRDTLGSIEKRLISNNIDKI